MDQGLGLQRRIALPPDHAPPALRVAILDYASRGKSGARYLPTSFVNIYRDGRHSPPADRVKSDVPFLVDLESDIGETADVSKEDPAVVKRLLALAEAMREDLGDYDRVGGNMRFFEADLTRRTKPVLE